jgi:hypothetical protein
MVQEFEQVEDGVLNGILDLRFVPTRYGSRGCAAPENRGNGSPL